MQLVKILALVATFAGMAIAKPIEATSVADEPGRYPSLRISI
jgi:hypothetical protein